MQKPQKIAEVTCGITNINAAVLSPTTVSMFAVGSSDRLVHIFSVDSSKLLLSCDIGLRVCTCLCFDSSERLLAVGTENGSVLLFDLESGGHPLTPTSIITAHRSSVLAIDFHPFSSTVFISASSDGTVKLWNKNSSNKETVCLKAGVKVGRQSTSEIRCVRFAPDGRHLLTGDDEGDCKIWDVTTHRLISTINNGIGDEITSLHFHHQETIFVAQGKHSVSFFEMICQRSQHPQQQSTIQGVQLVGQLGREAAKIKTGCYSFDEAAFLTVTDFGLKSLHLLDNETNSNNFNRLTLNENNCRGVSVIDAVEAKWAGAICCAIRTNDDKEATSKQDLLVLSRQGYQGKDSRTISCWIVSLDSLKPFAQSTPETTPTASSSSSFPSSSVVSARRRASQSSTQQQVAQQQEQPQPRSRPHSRSSLSSQFEQQLNLNSNNNRVTVAYTPSVPSASIQTKNESSSTSPSNLQHNRPSPIITTFVASPKRKHLPSSSSSSLYPTDEINNNFDNYNSAPSSFSADGNMLSFPSQQEISSSGRHVSISTSMTQHKQQAPAFSSPSEIVHSLAQPQQSRQQHFHPHYHQSQLSNSSIFDQINKPSSQQSSTIHNNYNNNQLMLLMLSQRLHAIKTIRSLWEKNEIKKAVEIIVDQREKERQQFKQQPSSSMPASPLSRQDITSDIPSSVAHPLFVDFFLFANKVLSGQKRSLNSTFTIPSLSLDVVCLLLPIVVEIVTSSVVEKYVVVGCSFVVLVCQLFTTLFVELHQLANKQTMAKLPLDLSQEERIRKTNHCLSLLWSLYPSLQQLSIAVDKSLPSVASSLDPLPSLPSIAKEALKFVEKLPKPAQQ